MLITVTADFQSTVDDTPTPRDLMTELRVFWAALLKMILCGIEEKAEKASFKTCQGNLCNTHLGPDDIIPK